MSALPPDEIPPDEIPADVEPSTSDPSQGGSAEPKSADSVSPAEGSVGERSSVIGGVLRVVRTFRRGMALVVLLLILTGVLVAQTGPGQSMALRAALDRVRGALAGELTVDAIRSGTLLSGATLRGVRLDGAGGREFLTADSVVIQYSLLSLLSGGPAIRSTILWGVNIEISRYADDGAVNVARLLAPRPVDTTDVADRPLSLGRIGIRDGRARILTPAKPGSRGPTVTGPGGELLGVLSFDDLDLDLEDATLVPSSAVAFEARLASFSSTISILPEPLIVREVFGMVSYGAQGIRVRDAAFRMPGTLLRGDLTVGPRRPGDAWTFRTELESDGWGDLRDIAWIDSRVPPGRFRGGADVVIEGAVIVGLDRLEIELEASNVVLDGDVRFADVMSMSDLQVTASPITLDRLEPWMGTDLPLAGWLSGQATFSGTLENLAATGRVTLVPTGFEGNPTTADFAGTIHRGENPGMTDFEALLDPLNYTTLESMWPGLPFSGTGSGRVELDGRVDEGVRIVADMTHLTNATSTSRVAVRGVVQRVDGGRWVTDLQGDLLPLGVGMFSHLAPDLGLQGSVSGPIWVQGPLEELSIRADLSADGGQVNIDGVVNVLDRCDGYRLEVDADSLLLTSLSTRFPERSSWSGSLVLEGRGLVLDSIEIAAVITARASRIGAVPVDTVMARVRVSQGVLITDSLEANVAGIALTVSGQMGLVPGRSGTLRVDFETPSLVGLRPLVMGLGDSVLVRDGLAELEREFMRIQGIEPDTLPTAREVRLQGAVSGTAHISGDITDFDLDLVVDAVGAAYKVHQVDTARMEISMAGLPRSPDSWKVEATGSGMVWWDRDFEQGRLEASMSGGRGSGLVELGRKAGEEYRAAGGFAFDSLGGEVELSEAEMRIEDQLWSLISPGRIAWDTTSVTVDSLHVARVDADPMDLMVDGTLIRGGESDFHFTVQGLHVDQVLHAVQREDLEAGGHVNVALNVRGPAEAPIIDGTFRVEGPSYGAMQLSRLEGTLDYDDQQATFQIDGWDGARAAVNVSGVMPLDLSLIAVEDRLPDGPLDIQVRADSLDAAIALSYVTALEEVLGVVSADVHIGGTLDAPEPEGLVTLSDGEWSIDAIGVRHRRVNGEVLLHTDRTVDVLLRSRGVGSAEVTGTVLIDPVRDPLFDLTFSFNRFEAVSRPDVEALISGDFDLTGTYGRPFAEGALTVDQATIYVDEFQRAAGVVDLRDPFLFERGIAVDTTALVAQPLLLGIRNPFFDNLRVDVTLSVPRDTWLRSTETNVEMGGDLEVRYDRSAGDFVLIGELEALRGSHLVLGRTFDLDEGTVSFIGRPGLNPDLSIQASTRIRRRENPPLDVTALVEGTLIRPVVTLSTDEAGLAEADLFSYLIFGQASGDLARGQTQVGGQFGGAAVSTAATGMVTYFGGALANQFGAALARGLPLDYLSVQQTGSAQGVGAGSLGLSGTRVEAGRYVGNDVFVVLVFRPASDQAQNSNFLGGARVEWALTDDYIVEAFREDRFLRTGSATLGAAGLLDNDTIWGVFLFRDWGY